MLSLGGDVRPQDVVAHEVLARRLPSWGIAILFGLFEAGSVWQAIATIPEFFWELSLGIWLTVRGFNPSALASLSANSE